MKRNLTRRSFLRMSGTLTVASSMSFSALGFACSDKLTNILILSGWNTHNIGDQGHTPGTLRFLEDYFPEAKITVWLSSTNEETNKLLRNRFSNIKKIVLGKIDKNGVCTNNELQESFDKCDLLIQNSGMLYNSFWKSPSILEACVNTNKPFVCYGQSFDGFNENDLDVMVERLSKAKAIYCRDTESFYYLRKIGVKCPILEFGPDGCFGIDLLNESKAEKYMNENGLESGKFISVIIRTNTPAGPPPKKMPNWEVGDQSQNPWNPDDKDNIQTELWMKKVRTLITHWVKTTGNKVFLAPEVSKEIKYAKWLVYDLLPDDIKPYVVHKSEWWNMDEASSIYKKSAAVIGLEPHSLIMGLAHGVPIIHMFSKRHGVKAWMFRDIGLPEWLIDIDEEPAETSINALMEIYNNYPHAKQKAKRAMTFVESRSSEMINQLQSITAELNEKIDRP